MELDSEIVANFCSITDCTTITAEYYLNAANGDLDMAIGLFYEGGGREAGDKNREMATVPTAGTSSVGVVGSSGAQSASPVVITDEEEDGGDLGENDELIEINRRIRAQQQGSFASPFEVSDVPDTSAVTGSSLTSPTSSLAFTSDRSRRLADLFRPPFGIMFQGTFEEARRQARELHRWMLVSVHAATEFPSQAMNRDIWNAEFVQSFIKDNFVFLQLNTGSAEARRYSSFYPFDELYPHQALVDPRTGERVETLLLATMPVPGFRVIDQPGMLEALGNFLIENPLVSNKRESSAESDEQDEPAAIKRVKSPESLTTDTTLAQSPAVSTPVHPEYSGSDAIVIQFRLPDGRKLKRCFAPTDRLGSLHQAVREILSSDPSAAAAFSLRTADGEIDENASQTVTEAKLHNTLITINK